MWIPHVTVAVVVEDQGRFLVVEEIDHGRTVLNQPAGHVEDGEGILDAAVRETLEETCWEVRISSCLGITRYIAPNGHTYFRHSFVASAIKEHKEIQRDPDIVQVHWLTMDELLEQQAILRSPMVLNDFNRFIKGVSFSLDLYSET